MSDPTMEDAPTVTDDAPTDSDSDSRAEDPDIESPANEPESGTSATQPCSEHPLTARIEALLLSTDRPLTDGKIAELLAITVAQGGTKKILGAIDELNESYEQTDRAFRIEAVAGGRQVLTLPAFGAVLHRLHMDRMQTRLTPAAMEALAIVAYRQPILRADVEAIRGVACGEVLRGLMERRMVKIVGRAEELGRPMLYGTTREFLRVFGLSSLEDLPQAKELREPSTKKKAEVKVEPEGEEQTASAESPSDSEDVGTPATEQE